MYICSLFCFIKPSMAMMFGYGQIIGWTVSGVFVLNLFSVGTGAWKCPFSSVLYWLDRASAAAIYLSLLRSSEHTDRLDAIVGYRRVIWGPACNETQTHPCDHWRIQTSMDRATPIDRMATRSILPRTRGQAIIQILNVCPLFCIKMHKNFQLCGKRPQRGSLHLDSAGGSAHWPHPACHGPP